MTSATFSVKKQNGRRFPGAPFRFFCWSLRKNVLISCIASILALLITPGIPLLSYFYEHSQGMDHTTTLQKMDDLMPGLCLALALLSGLLALILSSLNYRYMHGKAASDVFHALPLTRWQLLLGRFFSSYLMTMLPLVLSFAGTAVAVALSPLSGLSAGLFFGNFLSLAVLLFTCCAFMVLLAVSTGSGFDMFAALLVTNIGWPVVWLLVSGFCQGQLIGFPSISLSDQLDLLFLFSPFGRLMGWEFWANGAATDWADTMGGLGKSLAGCLLLGLVYLMAALLLYKRRKSEKAGSPYAFVCLPLVLQTLAVIIGGCFIGALFSFGDIHSLSFYIFMALGAVLGAIIPGAIFSRGFKKIKRDLLVAGSVFLVMLAVTGVIFSGGLGYENRLPKLADLRQVDLELNGGYVEYNGGGDMYDQSSQLALAASETARPVSLTEQADVQAVYELHEAIVEWIKENRSGQTIYGVIGDTEENQWQVILRVGFIYHTKWGTEISREYRLNAGQFIEQLVPILSSDAYRQATNEVYRIENADSYQSLVCSDLLAGTAITEPIAPEQMQKLIQAYKADLSQPLTSETLLQKALYRLTLQGADGSDRSSVTLTVYESYQQTRSVLKELGYTARLQGVAAAEGNGQQPVVYIPAESFPYLTDYQGSDGFSLLGYLYHKKVPVGFLQDDQAYEALYAYDNWAWSLQYAIGGMDSAGGVLAMPADNAFLIDAPRPDQLTIAPLQEEQYEICLYYMAQMP